MVLSIFKIFATAALVCGTAKIADASSKPGLTELTITVTNLAFQQPFSPFFVMVHSEEATPLFEFGAPPTEALALLAENGDPGPLVEAYQDAAGVFYAEAFTDGAPYFVGAEPATIEVEVSEMYPYVTIASMAINTNDCFIAIPGKKLMAGDTLFLPGLDAGSEENNELCESIPGPACAEIDPENERSGNGEGVVHVHRGFFGLGPDLTDVGYDWRNPMAKVYVS